MRTIEIRPRPRPGSRSCTFEPVHIILIFADGFLFAKSLCTELFKPLDSAEAHLPFGAF
jgi:hypothetical protein